MNDGYEVVNLGFTFKYFDRDYKQVSISSNGYVCFEENSECGNRERPSSHDILIGLNFGLDPTREGSGQIYYKHLDSNLEELKSNKSYLNPNFEPENIFMITYDNVLPYLDSDSSSRFSFQIFLSSSNFSDIKSFITFEFTSCPNDLDLMPLSGFTYINNDAILQEIKISENQTKTCTESNVGRTGVWVFDVTSRGNY
jgi:hypothetical protein